MTHELGRTSSRQRRRRALLLTSTLALLVTIFTLPAAAKYVGANALLACSTSSVLSGSNFEIDTNANLKVDGGGTCIDWLAGGTGSAMRSGVLSKNDALSGSGDDAFGQGTSEDDANPTVVTGSIPPNKSDLKVFAAFTETGPGGKFLELFWTRINSPQGTTNMDFELNQKFCDPSASPTNCANNGNNVASPITPVRTTGDKLVTYDLSKGGTVPAISIRTWTGSAWGAATVISGGANPQALGAVNTSTIAAADSGGVGSQDPFTFGEAAISFSALFPTGGQCGTFGSAYLKSRSSDSFTAELKDFIAPERVNISNCTTLTTSATASVTIGNPISDTATLAGATANATGTITFRLFFNDNTCAAANEVSTGLSPVTVSGNGNYNSGNVTPTQVGTYYWRAFYSGDLNNSASSTPCNDTGESSVVSKKQPALSTSATASVTIGSPISDTATLSGATSDATGTITFRLFFNDNTCAAANEVSTGLSPVNVSGNGAYGSGNFTPTAVGDYYWTASYSGDAKNLSAATPCNDTGEKSVVGKAPATISTAQQLFPQDSATVSATAGGTPTGSVTFQLFAPADTNCTGTAVYSQTVTLSGGSAATTNSTFSVSSATAATYRWKVSYSGDAKHDPTTSACGTEAFTLTIKNS